MREEIRKVTIEDVNGLKEVVESSDLFPPEYLDDMISDYFNNPETEDIWFTYLIDNNPVAIGYCAPEKFTNGTYNLYAIGVKKELQGKGIGHKMMGFIETLLRDNENRVLIVETSGSGHYKLTRQFYHKLGYRQEAIIKDFWNEGEDKVIFWKKLN
jgi:ribosomal protein S18 acetylase RimI-like enzyme